MGVPAGVPGEPDGTQCEACPPPDECAVGFYSGFPANSNACRSCLGCTAVSNAVFTSNGMVDQDPRSCSYRCNSGFYSNFGSCAPCSVKTCTSGSTFLKQCTQTSNAECVTCKQCLPGQRVERVCGSGNDTVCSACDPALLPPFASWSAAGCVSWACNPGYWLDVSICRKCSAAGDCALGFQLVDLPQCVASSSTARGKCDACPTPPAGQCFSGAANCGLRPCAAVTSMLRSTTTPLATTVAKYTTAPSPTSSGAILRASTTQGKTATVASQTPPPATPTPDPIAYATVASLTIDPSEAITSALLADLVRNVSRIVCLPDAGQCEVSVLSITVGGVTTFCIDGVCPGYSKRRRRRLLLEQTTEVNVGIISKTMVSDFSGSLKSIRSVVDIKVEPNAPVITTEQLAQLKDARALAAFVSEKSTVFNAVSQGLGVMVLALQVEIAFIISGVVLCCCCV